MKITIVGIGYVGLSNAIILAQKNEVVAIDIIEEKVNMINAKISPIIDEDIQNYLTNIELNLLATRDKKIAYQNADYVIISTPTNYNPITNYFDTSTVEDAIKDALVFVPSATIIIKSTVPIGFTKRICEKFKCNNIIFSPEFLREGKALYDNLYPSRIIVGAKSKEAKIFSELLQDGANKENIDTLYTNSTEAEAIKLFANTYLAMRVSFFNELDTYCELKDLKSNEVVKGISLDPRIGDYYNNPSFGYGGYCLPKDTKQLLANYEGIPNSIIKSIVESNNIRKRHISDMIKSKKPKVVGIYRLIMKNNSDNFRESAIQDVIHLLQKEDIEVVIYEPTLKNDLFENLTVIHDISDFKEKCDIIVANRWSDEILDVSNKIYTRDLFKRD